MQYVYVLNKHSEPLMPCSPGKARILLKQQKACVIKRTPFTIKLRHGSAEYKQPITLGVTPQQYFLTHAMPPATAVKAH